MLFLLRVLGGVKMNEAPPVKSAAPTVICTECLYCRIAEGHVFRYYVCVSPENQIQNGVSHVDGRKLISWRSNGVGETRGDANLCGPSGAWYKPIAIIPLTYGAAFVIYI